ncbi:MAG: Spy/CpxP family protein refolding chaperone [Phycisphaerales bacterium]|nr:Spy/CpxP family protein refolding chaperone [Phycisphaerales bacterium]
MRPNRLLCLILMTAVSAAVVAQDSAPPPPERPGGRQFEAFGPGGRGGPGGPMGGRFPWMGIMADRVAFELELDADQQAQFDDMRSRLREEMRGRMEGMRERWQEVRAMEDAGDEEGARKLRDELRGSMRGGPMEGVERMFDELAPVLRPEQAERMEDIRDRFETERERWERSEQVVRGLPDELEMNEEQRDQFRTMVRERMRSGWEERRPQMDSLMEEIRAAQESGDREQLGLLYARMDEARPNPERGAADMLADLEPLLTDTQRAKLAEIRDAAFGDPVADAARPGALDVRTILRAARRARLNSEQRDALRSMEREAVRDWRAARGDAAAQDRVAGTVKEQISRLLDADQRAAFEGQLERAARKAR